MKTDRIHRILYSAALVTSFLLVPIHSAFACTRAVYFGSGVRKLTLHGNPGLGGNQTANFRKAEPFRFLAPQ